MDTDSDSMATSLQLSNHIVDMLPQSCANILTHRIRNMLLVHETRWLVDFWTCLVVNEAHPQPSTSYQQLVQ